MGSSIPIYYPFSDIFIYSWLSYIIEKKYKNKIKFVHAVLHSIGLKYFNMLKKKKKKKDISMEFTVCVFFSATTIWSCFKSQLRKEEEDDGVERNDSVVEVYRPHPLLFPRRDS